MVINLEEHEITTILDALSEKPYKDVAAIIRRIVNQMAEEQIAPAQKGEHMREIRARP